MLRAVVVYGVLLVLVRVTGKRSVGQFTPFDMILLILLGTAVQNSLIGDDISLPGGLILAATLIGLNDAVGWMTARSVRLNSLVEGDPVLLGRDGRIFDDRLRRECISRADFDAHAECSPESGETGPNEKGCRRGASACGGGPGHF